MEWSDNSSISEHDVTRVMAGDVESVRKRLLAALEQIGYRILSEDPLRARHAARGAGRYHMSANALEYPTTLEISLRPQGHGATRVTFDYRVSHGYFTSGDWQTITREAEAIIALASLRGAQTNCLVCGSDAGTDSRFCRKCGAPLTSAAPAEVEVMRLTAETRAGHQWNVLGACLLAFAAIFPLLLLWAKGGDLSPKLVRVMMVSGLLFGGMGWWSLLAGLRQIHFALNPCRRETEEKALPVPRTLDIPDTNELRVPSASARKPLSITEGTTDLLIGRGGEATERIATAAPVYRREEKIPD